jgi:hypothetical protein
MCAFVGNVQAKGVIAPSGEVFAPMSISVNAAQWAINLREQPD